MGGILSNCFNCIKSENTSTNTAQIDKTKTIPELDRTTTSDRLGEFPTEFSNQKSEITDPFGSMKEL